MLRNLCVWALGCLLACGNEACAPGDNLLIKVDEDTAVPGTEICDKIDNDFDGEVDEADATDAKIWYADYDLDGYGQDRDTYAACDQPDGYADNADDCREYDSTAYPGAPETPYDGIDQDCDGEDLTDADGDGYDRDGIVDNLDDCDDTRADVNPGANEVCDDVDNDCNGYIDGEEYVSSAPIWYLDGDQDGYGGNKGWRTCAPPEEDAEWYVETTGDCDDDDDTIGLCPDDAIVTEDFVDAVGYSCEGGIFGEDAYDVNFGGECVVELPIDDTLTYTTSGLGAGTYSVDLLIQSYARSGGEVSVIVNGDIETTAFEKYERGWILTSAEVDEGDTITLDIWADMEDVYVTFLQVTGPT